MDVSFIGSGNVASHLAQAFSKHVNIKYIISSSLETATELCLSVDAIASEDYETVKEESDVILICVPDDLINVISNKLKLYKGNPVIAHVSGSIPAELLAGVSDHYGVIYPLQTFTKNKSLDISNVPFFINANSEITFETLKSLAEQISTKVYFLDDEKRLHLHIAAVLANNFINHLLYQTKIFIEKEGLILSHLKPLVYETISKSLEIGPFEAQTGPAKRNDEMVIASHLEYLDNSSDLKALYQTFTELIQKTYANR